MQKMNSIDSRSLPAAYSIDLYAINLKKENVPEKSARISNNIRRFTPEGLALSFRLLPYGRAAKIVSSHQVKQSQISDLVASFPTGVM
jgi:hypothetical protein